MEGSFRCWCIWRDGLNPRPKTKAPASSAFSGLGRRQAMRIDVQGFLVLQKTGRRELTSEGNLGFQRRIHHQLPTWYCGLVPSIKASSSNRADSALGGKDWVGTWLHAVELPVHHLWEPTEGLQEVGKSLWRALGMPGIRGLNQWSQCVWKMQHCPHLKTSERSDFYDSHTVRRIYPLCILKLDTWNIMRLIFSSQMWQLRNIWGWCLHLIPVLLLYATSCVL